MVLPPTRSVMASLKDARFSGTDQDRRRVVRPELFLQPHHARENLGADGAGVFDQLDFFHAEVAGAAVGLMVRLSEVVDQGLMSAGYSGAETDHVVEFGLSHPAGLGVRVAGGVDVSDLSAAHKGNAGEVGFEDNSGAGIGRHKVYSA